MADADIVVVKLTEELEAQRYRGDNFRGERDRIAAVMYAGGCPALNTASPQALEWLAGQLEKANRVDAPTEQTDEEDGGGNELMLDWLSGKVDLSEDNF